MRYKNYLLDCDGVILNSNNFKIEAMRKSLANYPPQKVLEFLDYFRTNFGKSRYQHIEKFFIDIIKKDAPPTERQEILERYASICQDEYLNCQLCEGVEAFLKNSDHSRCWVVSGSDQEELRAVFKKRGLASSFKEVLGSPVSKVENIRSIISRNNLVAAETCLIGDAMGDFDAAQSNEIDFVFCRDYSNTPELDAFFCDRSIVTVANLGEII